MSAFIHDDFLLNSDSAKNLYHSYAAPEPILDYHCHLSAKDVAEDRHFTDLSEIWLAGDHYKWRAMRANGIDERYCTGDAAPYEKFLAWARTIPHTLRNPLYHWSHLELSRYFGISELLDEKTAPRIWEQANSALASQELSAHGILKKFRVAAVCTTDDPADDLQYHRQIAASGLSTRVYPTFRPDRALQVHLPESFNEWVDRLAASSNTDIGSFSAFLKAIRQRHDFFHEMGCRISDHGLSHCYADFCSEATAASIFDKTRRGQAATVSEHSQFASFIMLYCGFLDAEKGWTKQLHLGALRNNNTRKLRELGPDTGFDSIGDWPQAESLARYLDRLSQENMLPKTIVYNLNPADNYLIAAMVGNFQDSSAVGKIQFGAGWWYLDQRDGIELQLNALSHVGLLSKFVGMLTDSRSFMSYPRHEYFRRILCDVIGNDIERGELPNDEKLAGSMIRDICFANARQYTGLALSPEFSSEVISYK